MAISPQSQSVLDRLDGGERVASGSESVGPLDAPTRLLLRVLVEQGEVLRRESGAEQARKLRGLYVEAKRAAERQTEDAAEDDRAESDGATPPGEGESESLDGAQIAATDPPVADGQPTQWRLHRLTCQGVRGVDPSGAALGFPFNGMPTLIFGPNGSGKSSLLGAIVWVLTGRIITDTDDDSEQATVYGTPRAGADRGSRICDWPVVVTLPLAGNPASATPACSAELQLESADGTVLWVRRSLSDGMETSEDRSSWSSCANLAQHGIEPLDLQLSLIAPTVFGRMTIEHAGDTRSLLSLMLGYDDVEALGDFASNLARNRTRLANEEQRDLDDKWTKVREKLRPLPNMLPQDSKIRENVTVLTETQKPTKEAIAEVGKALKDQIETAETELARLLGIGEEDQEAAPAAGIADKLTTAIGGLEKGVGACFPSLEAIRTEDALPEKDGMDPKVRLSATLKELEDLLQSFTARIAQRLDWWRKEVAPGSKAALRLRAAQDYDPDAVQCPVCEQSIEHLSVKDELAGLKRLDPELQQEIRVFFRNLLDEIEVVVPNELLALANSSPSDRIRRDWKNLCEETVGPAFDAVTTPFRERIEQIAAESPALADIQIDLFPEDAESDFVAAAVAFIGHVKKARMSVATLEWAEAHLDATRQSLHDTVTRTDGEDVSSLLAALSNGKQAAAELEPLAKVREELRTAYQDREAITSREANLRVLNELAAGLDRLKPLSKYAANEVSMMFGSIRDKTINNWRLLYPETSSGLDPARLILGKGRGKTVEALLGGGTYEVPGKHFANAGLQRAIALSFFFALLDKHPGGLGFVVMDDPILSLDEDHRESWSANLLRPALENMQVVLATHQRQYLNHCKYDFRDGCVVELNPRSRSRPMSWRPGFRLDRAGEELERATTNAPNELRKYREELLCTLDAYSPSPFFDLGNLAQSLMDYGSFAAPHPLASRGQAIIVECLNDPEVTTVLDPGSHHQTEADVSAAMSRQCLTKLRACDNRLRTELDRLERLRAHERRGRALPASIGGPLGIPDDASWDAPITIRALGRAAARQDSWVCDDSEDSSGLILPLGAAVVARAETLEPVVRAGQWLLVATEDVTVIDGDLVVAKVGERRLLRRAWTDGANWQLAAINPVRPASPVVAARADTIIRKIWGVVYEPLRAGAADNHEWQPRADFETAWLTSLRAIAVEGGSLEPQARRGQHVLVAGRESPAETTLDQGGLAVLETSDDGVGNVIKRVYLRDDQWVLVSPNPVETQEPILLPAGAIVAVWRLRGVLFESAPALES